jgi:hypothetical protein
MKSRIVKTAGSFSMNGRDRNAYKVLAGKPEIFFNDLGINRMLISK